MLFVGELASSKRRTTTKPALGVSPSGLLWRGAGAPTAEKLWGGLLKIRFDALSAAQPEAVLLVRKAVVPWLTGALVADTPG